jgi:hypothetical protein
MSPEPRSRIDRTALKVALGAGLFCLVIMKLLAVIANLGPIIGGPF